MKGNGIFKAGAARADTTPEIGTLLYGYNPHQVSTSIHDNLSVTALALRQGDVNALLITAEIGDIHNDLVADLRQKISTQCNIPYDHIIIACTHTHSAPNLSGEVGWGDPDMPYYNGFFLPAILKATKEAFENLVPAELAIGAAESKVGINRREQTPDGGIALGQNPWGCYDPNMTVISIRNAESKVGILNLIHYGCHGTACGCNHEITRDWSGIMIDRVEQETGTLTAYWNGAIGDVGPRLTNGKTVGDIRHVEELGGVAAFDAMRAYKAKGGYHPGNLELLIDDIRIPYAELPSKDFINAKLAEYENPEKLYNSEMLVYDYYKRTADILNDPDAQIPTHFVFHQTLLSLGDVIFVPSPFETFSEIFLRLRAYSPYPYTLGLSVTNGYELYLPTQDQLCRGGYEITCFRFGHVYPLADNTDQHLINENLRIMSQE
jgi:hypothetical protein